MSARSLTDATKKGVEIRESDGVNATGCRWFVGQDQIEPAKLSINKSWTKLVE